MMRLTLRQLKKLIREFGLDADMRNMAGSVMDLGGTNIQDKESSLMNPPSGLGGPQEEEDPLEQEKGQLAARVNDRGTEKRNS